MKSDFTSGLRIDGCRERVLQLVEEVKKETCWEAYRLRQPEAAQAALPVIQRIFDEELATLTRRTSWN